MTDISAIESAGRQARAAGREIAGSSGAQRTDAILRIAAGLRENVKPILDANALDLEAGRAKGLEASFIDRLALDASRVDAMARAVEEIAAQADPVGALESEIIRPNGLRVGRQRIPLGVVAVIYEARPNVTSDAAALALRSGNAIILKGGSDARHSNRAIGDVVTAAVQSAGLPGATVQVLTAVDRDDIRALLKLEDDIDVVIPRGGEALIRFVSAESRIPVIKHYKGVCHVYVDAAADVQMALRIIENGKVQRPSVCNSVETVLVHGDIADEVVPALGALLGERGVTIHGCERTQQLYPGAVPATEDDWHAEYLSLDVAVRVVDDIGQAIAHIHAYGSDHTEAIISGSLHATQRFRAEVQSSCVMVNASTRFADGGQLGLGAEIGISTSRLHAYGPMGAEGLTTTRFVVIGDGHIRE